MGYKTGHYALYRSLSPVESVGSIVTDVLVPRRHGYVHLDSGHPTIRAPAYWVRGARGELLAEVSTAHGSPIAIDVDRDDGAALLTAAAPGAAEQHTWLERFDAAGAPLGSVEVGGGDYALTVGATSDVLVHQGGRARWYDHRAAPLGDWFEATVTPGAWVGRVLALPDGSMVAMSLAPGGVPAGTGVIPPRAAVVTPAPAWMSALQERGSSVVRGGRALVLAPAPAPGACSGLCGRLELVTLDGFSCGALDLPGGSDEPVRVARDGTVFALTYESGMVHWRWWPKLLR
jgi:hypothetical protein